MLATSGAVADAVEARSLFALRQAMPSSTKRPSEKKRKPTKPAGSVRSGGVDIEGQQVTIAGDVAGGDIIKQEIRQEAPAIGVAALHQLPPPPRDFTGRETELAELLAQAEGDGVTISGLHGMGGVGKTALALVLADRLKERYPDAQLYLDLKGAHEQKPLTVAEALAHVIRAYHPTAQLPESEVDLQVQYYSVLNGKRALLLMDNAADGGQVGPLLPPASCFLLVTSRRHFTLPGLHAKNLDTLPPGDARALLLKIAPRIDGHADEMVKLCGYLPLALRLAGSAMAERMTLTVEDYLRRLVDAQARVELIDASLSLSYDLLSDELQRAWCKLSVFPDTFDLAAAAAVWHVGKVQVQDWLDALMSRLFRRRRSIMAQTKQAKDWLDALVRHSLVEWDETAARARLHDLARVFADAKMGDAERTTAKRRHAEHYKTVLRTANDLYDKGGENVLSGLALFDLERVNIEAGQAWAEAASDTDDASARLCCDYPNVGSFVLELRHRPRERIRWQEQGLAAARRLKDRGSEGWHLAGLGMAYLSLSDYDRAIACHEQHLIIAREMGDRMALGSALRDLGSAYNARGEHGRAIVYLVEALAIDREMGNRRNEALALILLGIAHNSLQEYGQAIVYQKQGLAIAREIGHLQLTGASLGRLGDVYNSLGEHHRAIEYFKQALDINRTIGYRREEGKVLYGLGSAYHSLGEHRRAIECHEWHLALAREMGDQLGEGQALAKLSYAYDELGEPAKATDYREAACNILKGIETPEAKRIANQLAQTTRTWGYDLVAPVYDATDFKNFLLDLGNPPASIIERMTSAATYASVIAGFAELDSKEESQ